MEAFGMWIEKGMEKNQLDAQDYKCGNFMYGCRGQEDIRHNMVCDTVQWNTVGILEERMLRTFGEH